MLIIKQTPLPNGAHQNQIGTFTTIPDDYIEIPADLEAKAISYLPFIKLTIKDGIVTTVSQGKIPDKSIIEARTTALSALDGKCSGAIYNGLDIGGKHYSFTQQAQANIKGLLIEAQQGKTAFLYAADGEPLSAHTAEQIQAIARVMGEWINVNLAYNEQLRAWIARETDSTVLGGIDYGVSLPADLMAAMGAKLAAVGVDAAVYAGMMGG